MRFLRTPSVRDPGLQLIRFVRQLHGVHDFHGHVLAPVLSVVSAQRQCLDALAELRQRYDAEGHPRETREDAFAFTIRALEVALAGRDSYTVGHVQRVASYSEVLGQELGLDAEALQGLRIGGVVHDIGKVGVSEDVITKAGPLSDEEWLEMKQHPTIGLELLQNLPFLLPAADVVAHHHERWDGSGYPLGLSGAAIPEAARIVAVADAFDALTTDRAYRPGRSAGDAVEEIEAAAGSYFDPDIVAVLPKTLAHLRRLVPDR